MEVVVGPHRRATVLVGLARVSALWPDVLGSRAGVGFRLLSAQELVSFELISLTVLTEALSLVRNTECPPNDNVDHLKLILLCERSNDS
jgi:hypothetical protein